MPRSQARFVCQQCGSVHAKWTGRCEGCGAWNSLIEELPREVPPQGLSKDRRGGRALGFVALTFASVNIFGGFLVTQRMLGMFQRKQK